MSMTKAQTAFLGIFRAGQAAKNLYRIKINKVVIAGHFVSVENCIKFKEKICRSAKNSRVRKSIYTA